MFIGQYLIGSPRAFSDHLPTLPYEGMTHILSLKWPVEEKQYLYKPKRGQASRLRWGLRRSCSNMVLKKKGSKTRPISASPLCSISIAKSQILAQWKKASIPHLHQDFGLQPGLSTNYAAHLEIYFMERKINLAVSFLVSSITVPGWSYVFSMIKTSKNFLCICWNLPSPTLLLQSSLPCAPSPVWRFSIWSHAICFKFQFFSLPAYLENLLSFSSLLFHFTVK